MVGVEYWGLVFLSGRTDERDRVGQIRGFFFLGGLTIGMGWGRLGARVRVWASGRGRTDGMGWDGMRSDRMSMALCKMVELKSGS